MERQPWKAAGKEQESLEPSDSQSGLDSDVNNRAALVGEAAFCMTGGGYSWCDHDLRIHLISVIFGLVKPEPYVFYPLLLLHLLKIVRPR